MKAKEIDIIPEAQGEVLCPVCGSVKILEEGKYICPSCDVKIDYFGDDDEDIA